MNCCSIRRSAGQIGGQHHAQLDQVEAGSMKEHRSPAIHDPEHRQLVGAGRRPQDLQIDRAASPAHGFDPHPWPGSGDLSAMLDRRRVRHADHRQRQRLDDLYRNLGGCSGLTHLNIIQRALYRGKTQHELYDASVAAPEPGDALLRVADIARRFQIAESTVRAYHSRGEMPAANGYDKAGPWWTESTIAAWDRPGRGRRRGTTSAETGPDYSAD